MKKISDIFSKENMSKVFEPSKHKGEYVAFIHDEFSDLGEKNAFGREWAHQFNGGRYVILVLQRHSVYEDGKCIYTNDLYEDIVGKDSRYKAPRYVIILDRAQEYMVPSWKSKLVTHMVHDENNTLQPKAYTDIKKAGKDALKLSENGSKAAVLGWYEDYDMF